MCFAAHSMLHFYCPKILKLEAMSVELAKLPRTKLNTHQGKDKSLTCAL
ncbi:hypothetical protein Lalb_Chr17g0338051 [Lupinus albus]|uniref:Uncharacterized protein n=1 Tax=Lupinus albus TaxID=3870 RepID=A0A6A4P932_LUPAL|nr:hypothetical protein Lalb_Chr17g0338051 [Lupinus albus]